MTHFNVTMTIEVKGNRGTDRIADIVEEAVENFHYVDMIVNSINVERVGEMRPGIYEVETRRVFVANDKLYGEFMFHTGERKGKTRVWRIA